MAVNKVTFAGNTLIDLTADTVTADTLAVGVTAHDASGKVVTGTMEAGVELPTLTNEGAAADLLSGKQLIDDDGNIVTGSMPSVTQATPSISVSTGGLITASATQSAGKVAAGTKSATKQLTVQAAQTITPGTSNKTIASGRYLTGTQTIKGDANLIAENIKSGVSIFDVLGTLEAGGGEGESAAGGVCGYITPAEANADLNIEHNLGVVPKGWLIHDYYGYKQKTTDAGCEVVYAEKKSSKRRVAYRLTSNSATTLTATSGGGAYDSPLDSEDMMELTTDTINKLTANKKYLHTTVVGDSNTTIYGCMVVGRKYFWAVW